MQKVTAGIIEKDGKILIAKRKTGKCIGAKWEFPGGKLEENETLEECLARELMEELNIQVKVHEYVDSSRFFCGEKEIELIAFRVTILSGEIKLVDHEEIKWIAPQELLDYELTVPDVPIAKKVISLFQ